MDLHNTNENLKKISKLLTPEVFKSNLILTSVFIAYFENCVDYIIEQPRTFFSDIFDSEKGFVTSPKYYDEVLSLDKKNPINASLLWFKNLNCITNEDFEDFGILRRYRNKVTHELPKILMDEGLNIDEFAQNLSKLFSLRIKIEKWWFFNFEIDFMEIENVSELNENDVTTGGEMLYKLFMDLLSEDEEKANFYSKEIKKRVKQDLK